MWGSQDLATSVTQTTAKKACKPTEIPFQNPGRLSTFGVHEKRELAPALFIFIVGAHKGRFDGMFFPNKARAQVSGV